MDRSRNQYPDIKLSQRELTNIPLVKSIVQRSSIRPGDIVYDIGAGSGVITRTLLDQGARVVAVEKDEKLYRRCMSLPAADRLTLIHRDFLDMELPASGSYKVFANIPFFHTSEIIRKLLFSPNPPEDCYLIVQKEAAAKYTGVPRETLQSLLVKPVFWSTVICYLSRSDFRPVPSVDTVLLQFQLRTCRLVESREYRLYRDFIVYCRESGFRTITGALGPVFTRREMDRLRSLLDFDLKACPLALSFPQYLSLFQSCLATSASGIQKTAGAEGRLQEARKDTTKIHRTLRRRLPGHGKIT